MGNGYKSKTDVITTKPKVCCQMLSPVSCSIEKSVKIQTWIANIENGIGQDGFEQMESNAWIEKWIFNRNLLGGNVKSAVRLQRALKR